MNCLWKSPFPVSKRQLR